MAILWRKASKKTTNRSWMVSKISIEFIPIALGLLRIQTLLCALRVKYSSLIFSEGLIFSQAITTEIARGTAKEYLCFLLLFIYMTIVNLLWKVHEFYFSIYSILLRIFSFLLYWWNTLYCNGKRIKNTMYINYNDYFYVESWFNILIFVQSLQHGFT